MSTGIKNVFRLAATQSVTSSTALVTATGLSIPIAANQELHIRGCLVVTVGAAGGVAAQLTAPAAPTYYLNSWQLNNTVAPSTATAVQAAQATFGNALANAGTHFIWFEFHLVNGVTAGTVAVQFAQNSSNATACQLLRGSWMETTGGPF